MSLFLLERLSIYVWVQVWSGKKGDGACIHAVINSYEIFYIKMFSFFGFDLMY